MKYVELELDKVNRYISLTREEFEPTFHEFSDLIYQYTVDNDPEIFDRNKHRLIDAYRNYTNGDLKYKVLFRKISKIRELHTIFQKDKKWRNPMIARQVGRRYLCHPGADRIQILKYHKVETYKFFVLENHEFSKPIASKIISKHYKPAPNFSYWYDETRNWFKFSSFDESYSHDFVLNWLKTNDKLRRDLSDPRKLILENKIKRKSS
jgi:hypothetical protein